MIIISKTKTRIIKLIYISLWLTGWIVGGGVAIILPGHFNLFLGLWVFFWFFAILLAIREIYWYLFGYEKIMIDSNKFVYLRKRLLFNKVVSFPVSDLVNVFMSDEFGNKMNENKNRGNVTFVVGLREYTTMNEFIKDEIESLKVLLNK